jgi:hypothetical protein
MKPITPFAHHKTDKKIEGKVSRPKRKLLPFLSVPTILLIKIFDSCLEFLMSLVSSLVENDRTMEPRIIKKILGFMILRIMILFVVAAWPRWVIRGLWLRLGRPVPLW